MLSRASVTQINVLDTWACSASFGNPGGDHVELVDEANNRALQPAIRWRCDGFCSSVGWTNHVGVMRGLVEGRVKLGRWERPPHATPPAHARPVANGAGRASGMASLYTQALNMGIRHRPNCTVNHPTQPGLAPG